MPCAESSCSTVPATTASSAAIRSGGCYFERVPNASSVHEEGKLTFAGSWRSSITTAGKESIKVSEWEDASRKRKGCLPRTAWFCRLRQST